MNLLMKKTVYVLGTVLMLASGSAFALPYTAYQLTKHPDVTAVDPSVIGKINIGDLVTGGLGTGGAGTGGTTGGQAPSHCTSGTDTDGDCVADADDNCPFTANA